MTPTNPTDPPRRPEIEAFDLVLEPASPDFTLELVGDPPPPAAAADSAPAAGEEVVSAPAALPVVPPSRIRLLASRPADRPRIRITGASRTIRVLKRDGVS